MRTLIPFHLVALLMLAVAMPATAQPSAQRNAATWYERAIEQYEKLPKAQRDMLESYDPATGAPTPELRAALSQTQSMLQNMQRGSAREFSDFNLDFTQGFELLLPHLNRLRNIARIARTDAMVRLHDGDTSGAAERIASLYNVGGHGGDDRTILSSLVGQAIFNEADRAAQFGLDAAKFNPADAARLFSATKQLGTNDPFNYLEGLAGEQEYTIDWIANTFTGEDGAAKFAERIAGFGEDQGRWAEIAALDEDQFAAALDEHDALLNQVIEIFSMPDEEAAKAEIAKLEEKFERHEMGPISQVMTPSLSKLYERKIEGEKRIAERIALFEKLATDQAKPQDAANAAIWYLQGIELLEKLEPVKLALIRKAARENLAQPSAELTAALSQARPAIELFREASHIKRCDFRIALRDETSRVVPPHVAGMHDGLLALHADALQSLSAGNSEDAVDRLTISFRAGAHLGDDPHLVSAVVAHHHFIDSLALFESALLNKQIAPSAKPQVLDAVERISRKDPFGYLGAVTEARKTVAELLGGLYRSNQVEVDRHAKAHEFAQALSLDQALCVLIIYQLLNDASAEPATPQPSLKDASRRMSDVLLAEAIESAAMQLVEIGPALAAHDWSVITQQPPSAVTTRGTLAEHIRRARGDVRRAMLLLKPFDAKPSSQPGDLSESDRPR
jgi:hypothetical protein